MYKVTHRCGIEPGHLIRSLMHYFLSMEIYQRMNYKEQSSVAS